MPSPEGRRSWRGPLRWLEPALGLGEARPYRESDFMPAALEIMERPASPAARVVAAAIGAFATLALVWASFGTVDIVAVAPGTILPIGNSKVIQPFETAVVQVIRVKDGQHVEPGQELIDLNAVSALADRDQASADLIKTDLDIARLEGLRRFIGGAGAALVAPPAGASPQDLDATRAAVRAEADEQQAKLAGFDRQIAEKTAEATEAVTTIDRLKESLPVATEQEALRRKLHDEGYGTSFEWLNAKEHLIEEQHDLPAAQSHREEAIADADALRRQREQTRAEFEKSVLSDLATARQKHDDLIAQSAKANERVSLLTLKAPIAGTVQQLAIHTVGGVVTPAQSLMVIAPDAGGLVVEAHIQNKDIGFVRAGQEAQVKIETFNFTRYGLIRGKVLDVSRDAVATPQANTPKSGRAEADQGQTDQEAPDASGYVAHVALDKDRIVTEAGLIALGPGMKVTAEIKTGQRTVISYLLSPVLRYKHEALRER